MAALLLQTPKFLRSRLGIVLAICAASAIAVLILIVVMLAVRPGAGDGPPAIRHFSEAELKALAPRRLAGLERTDLKVQTADGMDVPATALDARYRAGSRQLDLKIVYSPDLEQVIGFGGVATTAYDRPSAGGYRRRWREGDAIFVENLDTRSGAAAFGQVRHNLYVLALGQGGVSVEQLRAAVGRVGDRALPGAGRGG